MKKGVSVLLSLCLLLSMLVASVNAATDVTFTITTDLQGPLAPGDEVTFTVTINGTSKVTNVGFNKPQFDTDVFEYITDDPETDHDEAISCSVSNALITAATRNDGLAALWMSETTLPGSLELGKITLRVKDDAPLGDTYVTALRVKAMNGDDSISSAIQGASINIGHIPGPWQKIDNDFHNRFCSVCGQNEEIAAHVWDDGVVTVAPTCTEDGVMTFTCECGATKQGVIPATRHAGASETTFADQQCYYCSACDNYFFQDGSYVMATVVFQNWDGTVLSTENYRYKDKVEVPADPTKDADNTYTYTFDGWDKEVVSCAGNTTYTATYEPIYIDYTVVFQYADGTQIAVETYHYGDTVVAPEDPAALEEGYVFDCWDKEVAICSGDAVYTAQFRLEHPLGDYNKDYEVNNEDVIYLLWHTLFPDSYPIMFSADFTKDGEVNNEDVIYLLWFTLFPDSYPLS